MFLILYLAYINQRYTFFISPFIHFISLFYSFIKNYSGYDALTDFNKDGFKLADLGSFT